MQVGPQLSRNRHKLQGLRKPKYNQSLSIKGANRRIKEKTSKPLYPIAPHKEVVPSSHATSYSKACPLLEHLGA